MYADSRPLGWQVQRGSGHESCVIRSRVFQEVWVADFAWLFGLLRRLLRSCARLLGGCLLLGRKRPALLRGARHSEDPQRLQILAPDFD